MSGFRLKTTGVVLLLLLVWLAAVPEAEARKKPWEKFKYPALGEYGEIDYERVEMPNGMIVFLAEDRDFPVVRLVATIHTGGIFEPADKVGMASITGSVLRTGGTESKTGDEIDELVEARGMVLETWVGATDGGAYLFALQEDAELGMSLLADILMHPRFDPDKIVIAKNQEKAGISRRNDDPMTIARREAVKVVYGADHPLARHPEYDSINSIAQQDLFDFHARYFHPNYTYLVVIGDFQRDEMIATITKAFQDWQPTDLPPPTDPEIPDFPRTVNVVDKDDLTQSTLVLGHIGIRADDPNYAAIQVANRILGGGFSSRLFVEVRSNRGYAYSVGSIPGTGFRFPGVFMSFCGTKSGTTEASVDVIIDQIEKMTTEPVTAEELEVAKNAILDSEVFDYDTKREILNRLVMFERYGYEPDFLKKYQEKVRNMTAEKVLAACQAVWHPEKLAILAVGNRAEWDGDLTTFGPVTEVDITIPDPDISLDIPAATEESLRQGQEWMARAATAMAGDKLASLAGYREKMNLDAKVMGMELAISVEKTTQLPNRQLAVQSFMGMQVTSCLNGDSGWIKAPPTMGGEKDMTADQVAEARSEIATDTFVLFRDHAEFSCQALPPAKVEGRQCLPVYISGLGEDDDYILLFLDADTSLPFITQSPGQQPGTGAAVTQKVKVTEYSEMDGVKVAKTFLITHDDEEFATGTTESFELNPAIDKGLFQK